MKTKIICGLCFLFFFATTSTKAQTIIKEDINKNNEIQSTYKIEENKYEKVKKILTEEEIKSLNNQTVEEINNSSEIIDIKIKNIKSTYLVNGKYRFLVKEEIVSPFAYNDGDISSDKYETTYKQIVMIVSKKENGRYGFYIQNSWKKEPVNKSFDVIAFRWTGNVNAYADTNFASQDYKQYSSQVNPPTIEYSKTSKNYKRFNNGIGISQNLVDEGKFFVNVLRIDVSCQGSVKLYGTYQHAQGDLSLTKSQSYTLSNAGLGNVLYYSNSQIRNTYDGMQGVSTSFIC